jgi:hypothetical protein
VEYNGNGTEDEVELALSGECSGFTRGATEGISVISVSINFIRMID